MMKFCSHCAAPLQHVIPKGDNRIRSACTECQSIHYFNPRVITGCLPVWDGKVLLCRRNIEPRFGLWTIPAGFLELGETTLEGAIRETWEEAKTKVSVRHLHGLYNIPHIDQIYTIYLADMLSNTFEPTLESSEVALFSIEEIPWNELAFRVVEQTLKDYIESNGLAKEVLHHRDIPRN